MGEEFQPVGPLLDSLGVQREVVDGELVVGAVVLLKVLEADGTVSMRSAWSPGLSWMERVGMHSSAAQVDMPGREQDAAPARRDDARDSDLY